MRDLDEIILSSQIQSLKKELSEVENIIIASIPHEVLYTRSGEINLSTRHGSLVLQIRGLRAIINTFD